MWIVEYISGLIPSADMTIVFEYGCWASYNSPSFKIIRNLSEYNNMKKEQIENIFHMKMIETSQLIYSEENKAM